VSVGENANAFMLNESRMMMVVMYFIFIFIIVLFIGRIEGMVILLVW
jgi:hypothetical protein